MSKKVIVIGGGLGGLSGAIRLAVMGFRVTLFEKNAELGGKMGEFLENGYRFDTGPSLLTMPSIAEDLFAFAGTTMDAHLQLEVPEPLTRYHYPDGTILNAGPDDNRMMEELRRLAPDDVGGYKDFLEYSKKIYQITSDLFLNRPVHELTGLLTFHTIKSLFKLPAIDPFRTMHSSTSRFFDDPRLIQLFDRYATYTGSNPFQAPATLNIIPWVEFGIGGFYIRDGMYRLVESLRELALGLGVEIHTESPVEEIFHSQNRVNGVRVNGSDVPADYVLCNADVVTAANRLIRGYPRWTKRLNNLEPSLSGMVFFWGVRNSHPELAHHNIFFSEDYREEFRQIFREKRTPANPTVYAAITSKTDPEHAPDGGENWFVLLNMPYLASGQHWPQEVSAMRLAVLRKLRKHGIDLTGRIESETVTTPPEFAKRYAANRGSIYGLSSNGVMSAFNRQPNRSRVIDGLYFAGGSAHPGGGIPLVLLSGKHAANLIADHAGVDMTVGPKSVIAQSNAVMKKKMENVTEE